MEFSKQRSKGMAPLSKSVKFADSNEVFPIPHLDDMSDDEIADVWYDCQEYSEIKSAFQVTLHLMETGQKILHDDEEHTSRGLEYRTQDGAWARYENKRDAYNAVLDEQDRQWKDDADDHDALSRVYLEHSAKCLEAARKRAKEDARIAKKICADLLDRCKKPKRKSSKKVPSVDKEKMRKLLRQNSMRNRNSVRDDIQAIQRKNSKVKRQQAITA
jgi:hypothetical protein